ncbi:MAG: OmpA family protein [Leptospiraceae bacterium]|nr:OmpA family protein [Leptospiraceae bacterium]MDW7976438.1 OmpA family protein [Leptospiraceae bacterium]
MEKIIPFKKTIGLFLVSIFGIPLIFSHCQTAEKIGKQTLISTAIGCGAGLALGAIYDEVQRKRESEQRRKDFFAVLKKRKEQNQGKIVGLAAGCLAGLGTGLYLDLMYDDIQNQFGARGINLEKIPDEKGETKELLVKMDGDINFQVGSAELQGVAKENVARLKEALEAYPETAVRIWGHTDKTGNRKFNEKLSEDRAKTVANALNLPSNRVAEVKGWAWDRPLDGTGASPANRRVEVRIIPLN